MEKMMIVSAVVFLLAIFGQNDALHRPTVRTTAGHLKGLAAHVSGRPLIKFLGVPYAKTPVRFSRAEEFSVEQENELINADQFQPSCMQPPHLRKVIYRPLHDDLDDALVSEDCLNLNIYVPGRRVNESKASPMAVMVWLPGEGFDFGYANQYDGSRLAVHGQVIVVTVNYRLSVFGFLSTGDKQAPGNLGLSDQITALKWLKKNLRQLGGDPERVTVFGRLTGSMSISALIATVEGPQVFQRAILQSGIAHGDWIFENKPLEQALLLANKVGCAQSNVDNINTTRLVNCLRKVPAKTLLKTAIRSPRAWRLTLDDQFLVETPLKRTSRPLDSQLDVMLGTNEHEGSVCLLSHLAQKSEYMDKFLNNTLSNDDLRDLVQSHMGDYYGVTGDDDLSSVVHNLYRCGTIGESLDDCRQQFLNFCGDMYSHSAVTDFADKLVQSLAIGSNVYRYEFAHRPTFSHYPEFVGAAQGDEVLFVFGLVDEEAKLENITSDEIRLGHQMMTMWSNFAKNGNPNTFQKDIWWPRYNDHGEYLKITRRMGPQSVRKSAVSDRVEFWIDLNQKPSTSTTSSR